MIIAAAILPGVGMAVTLGTFLAVQPVVVSMMVAVVFLGLMVLVFRGAGVPWQTAWIAPLATLVGAGLFLYLELWVFNLGLNAALPPPISDLGILPWIGYAITLPVLVIATIWGLRRHLRPAASPRG